MKFTREEVIKESKKFFNDDLAATVFTDKYAMRNSDGEFVENSPDMLHERLASEFARIEAKNKDGKYSKDFLFNLFKDFKYIIPQGSPMAGIGNDNYVMSLGNCWVLPKTEDSYGGILKTDEQIVQLAKRRGGIGICLDNIRPKGMPTRNAAKTTDGIGVFMERFSNSTREVAQSGRRGALLESLSVLHPDIETFINIKRDKTKVTGANISIQVTDEFMNAIINNEDYTQRWPLNSDEPKILNKVSAKKIWDQFIESNWESAEPGVLFKDTIDKYSLSHPYRVVNPLFEEIATNPCGEITMGVDSCRLMLINLYSYVDNKFLDNARFDFDLFIEHAYIAQRLMDDLIDLELEKMDKIISKVKSDPENENTKRVELELWEMMKSQCELGRRTGLGITGLGDALAALNIKYGSDESIEMTGKIYRLLALASMKSSCEMARDFGTFPVYNSELEKGNAYLENLFDNSDDLSIEVKKLHDKFGRRNISLTTTAPAGSVSILTRTTSGVEPVFLISYKRRKKCQENEEATFTDVVGDKWIEFDVYHNGFKDWMEATGKTNVEDSPYYGATSNDVSWEKSVMIQAIAQKYISHSISKTCNLPKTATKELVSKVYLQAWKSGCKGFTIYRDGSRDGVLVSSTEDKKEESISLNIERPKELPAQVFHCKYQGKNYYLVLGFMNDKPYEIFAGINEDNGDTIIPKRISNGILEKKGKGKYVIKSEEKSFSCELYGKHVNGDVSALTRMISICLRTTPLDYVVKNLEKTEGTLFTYAKVISRFLKKYLADGKIDGEKCPQCGGDLHRTEGCISCHSCGWSKCG